jgi:ABC-type multidrug transport system permease subunit
MFTLLVLFTSGAVTLTIERNQGLLRRLASAPLSRRSIVFAKFLSRFVLGLIQIAFAMITGALLFQVDWGPHLAAVIPLLTVYAACAAMLGMLLGNMARTEGQVIGFAVIATNVVAAVGGCWWPIEITPAWMQKLALAVPTGWAMDALHKLVSFGDTPVSVLPHFLALLATTVASGLLVARSFRFQ